MKAWIKVRILSDVPLYETQNKSSLPISQITGRPIVEATTASPGFYKIKFADGRIGFVSSDVPICQLKDMHLNEDAGLHVQPSLAAPAIALKKGAYLSMSEPIVDSEGSKWVKVSTVQGVTGFMAANTKVAIQKARPRIQRESGDGKRNMLVGGAWCFGGLLLTIVTYQMASNSPGGGTYIITWGPVLFGGYRFFKGLSQSFSADPD